MIISISGVRGIYNLDFNIDTAKKIIFCYYDYLRNKLQREPKIVIGYDTRSSSLELRKSILDIFFNIIDIGIAPTPTIQFGVRKFKADGGIIITASHNPPEYNGFKFLNPDGSVLDQRAIDLIKNKYNKISCLSKIEFLNNYIYKKNIYGVKHITKQNIIKAYFKFLLSFFRREEITKIKNNHFNIVIDPNGGTGFIVESLLKELNVNTIPINMEVGKFKRAIEPTQESLSYLTKIIKAHNADFGVGFDCDADRAEIIMSDGKVISGHYLLALIIDTYLSGLNHPNKEVVIINKATSNVVKEVAQKYKAKVIEVDVGEINVIKAMQIYKAKVGGEGSSAGVIISPSRCRDGILTLLYILNIIAKRGKTLKELINTLPYYYTLTKKIKIKGEISIKGYFKNGFKIKESGDSLKLISKDSFIFIRKSKTEENLLRIIVDAKNKHKADTLLKKVLNLIEGQKFK